VEHTVSQVFNKFFSHLDTTNKTHTEERNFTKIQCTNKSNTKF